MLANLRAACCPRLWIVISSVAVCLKSLTAPPGPNLSVFHQCGMSGDAQGARVQALDRWKNRFVPPSPQQFNPNVTLEAMLAPGADDNRWSNSFAADVTGYVMAVAHGGIETCNCHATADPFRDTHIALAAAPTDIRPNQWVVVEVTPRWRYLVGQHNVDWSTKTLFGTILHHRVRVRGWMLFDAEHRGESENTAPGGARNWRATAWEIHPIVSLETVQ